MRFSSKLAIVSDTKGYASEEAKKTFFRSLLEALRYEGRMMTEQRAAEWLTRRSANVPSEEWLGGESHVPGLSRELRQRHRSTDRSSFRWMVFSIFIAGFALGTVITLLSGPRRLSS